MESEYIIVYDENGEPHLEHAWLRRGQAHKYIMKIGEGLKARYFYTQAEVDAYMNRGKQKAQNAVDKAKTGVDRAAFEAKINARRMKNATENAVEKKITGNKAQHNRYLMQKNAEYNERMAKYAPENSETKKFHEEAAKKSRERAELYNQEYKKSLAGKAENAVNEVKNNAKSAAKRLNENTKSKMDKMREEFRKPGEAVKEKVQEIKDSKQAKKEAQEKANKEAENRRNIDYDAHHKALDREDSVLDRVDGLTGLHSKVSDDDQIDAYKIAREINGLKKDYLDGKIDINERNAKIDAAEKKLDQIEAKNEKKEARENNRKSRSSEEKSDGQSKSKYGEYTKGDSDFDDKNFDEKNRVGDSDFFMAKRPDGSTVILEEDMKWVLPKGVNPNDPAIKRALTKEYKADSNEEWVKQVTEAIDEAVEKEQSKRSGIENSERSKRIDTMLDSLGNTTVSNFTRANINAYRQMYQEGKISESEYKRIMKNFEEELNKYSNENRR